jgi:DNA-binding Lrp family transcriptional regulator
MPSAIILVNAELGKEAEVAKAIRAIDSVTEVDIVYGVYDILVRLEARSMEQLNAAILRHIRGIPNIRSTITMIVVEGPTA